MKIQHKISLSMIFLLVFLILFIYLTSVVLLQNAILSDSLQRIKVSQLASEKSLKSSYNKYMFQFSKLVSNPSFQNILTHMANQDKSPTENRLLLQDIISSLIAASPTVEMVYFIDNFGNSYHGYGTYYQNESDLFFFRKEDVSGITVFPQQKSPFSSNNQVIPIVIPLTLKYSDQLMYTMIADSSDNIISYVTILVSSSSLNELIQLWYTDFKPSHIYFIDRSGHLLSSSSRSLSSDYENDLSSSSFLYALFESNSIQQNKLSDAYVTATALTPNLALISISKNDDIFTLFSTLEKYLVFALFIGLILTAFMSILISLFVSGPIARLAEIVHKIRTNAYSEIYIPHSTDEVGELNEAINDMYLTIKEQIKQIKASEREKFNTEIQLLTEQINPHLLYNTLEFINMEIYNGHSDIASNMIQALANYMRISLSYGNDKIFIHDEIAHVRAYLKMMNYRFNNNMLLLTSVSDDLKYCYVIKSILQPFVENSIKHGFIMEAGSSPIYNPTIEIAFELSNEQLRIIICDNGLGFNPDEMYHLLQDTANKESKKHVGLRNVIQRLEATYSNVTITLNSVPYYRNEITLQFPYQLDYQEKEAFDQ